MDIIRTIQYLISCLMELVCLVTVSILVFKGMFREATTVAVMLLYFQKEEWCLLRRIREEEGR